MQQQARLDKIMHLRPQGCSIDEFVNTICEMKKTRATLYHEDAKRLLFSANLEDIKNVVSKKVVSVVDVGMQDVHNRLLRLWVPDIDSESFLSVFEHLLLILPLECLESSSRFNKAVRTAS